MIACVNILSLLGNSKKYKKYIKSSCLSLSTKDVILSPTHLTPLSMWDRGGHVCIYDTIYPFNGIWYYNILIVYCLYSIGHTVWYGV